MATASGVAMPTLNQSGQPSRSTMGRSSAARTTASAPMLASAFTKPAPSTGSQDIGSMTSAANGG